MLSREFPYSPTLLPFWFSSAPRAGRYSPYVAESLARADRKGWCLVRREVNVLAMVKGNERYIYIFGNDAHDSLINALRDHAADPELSLNWYDAAVLTHKADEQVLKCE